MQPEKRFLTILFAVCLAILASQRTPFATQAQTTTIRFEKIAAEDGLSQNSVLAILQDQQGFMWFGTEGGLNKYDGYQFNVYKHDPADPSTLSDDFVSVIYEDRSGDLWVGTRSGLGRLDRATGMFTRYQYAPDDPDSLGGTWVVAICEDSEGALWVGTEDGGLDQLDRDTGAFVHHQRDAADPTTLIDNYVREIYEDRDGALWVGTDSGLDRLDRKTGIFTHYQHIPDDPHSLGGDKVSAILEDRQGMLWIGTEDGGLSQFDRSSQTFTRYQHDPDDPHSLSHNRVRAIFEDSTSRLWIGTQNGLDLYDRGQDQFVHYRHNPNDPHSLSGNAVWSIYEDRAGVLWFGTYGGGVSKYNRTTDQFTLYQHNPGLSDSLSDNMVWSIYEDRSGMLWIGTFNGGLNSLDRDSDTFTVYRHDPQDPASLSSDDVRAILEDREGALWVGTSGGLDRFDPQTETFTHLRHNPDDPTSLSENRVLVLYEDLSGNLWVGTRNEGLNRFDQATETFVRYQHDPDDPFSLSDNRVWALYEDSTGALWVSTLEGINVLDVATGRFTHHLHDPNDPQSLSNDQTFSFYEDPTGAVWIGTWGSGLDRFDRATRTFTHYTEKDGLPDNVIYGIEVDSAGFLWMSTNKGLSKFEPRTETFQNYDVSAGLQNNEFNVGAHFTSDSGEMFFGGIQGFNAFYPEQVTGNPHVPPIVVTAFSKFNEVVRTDLSSDEHIQLSYQDNFISFEFAALDYAAPEKNQYAYMLEGQDPGWVAAGTRRHVDYTNLRGGEYVFRVKGSNNDGVWNEEGVAILITVTPPVWETWWFRGIVLLVLAGSVIGGYRLRVRSVEARSRELEVLVEERSHDLAVLLKAERRRAEQFRVIGEMGRHITSIMAVDGLLEQIVTLLKEAFNYSIIAIGLIEGDDLVYWPRAAAFWGDAQLDHPLRIKVGQEGITGWVAQSGEPLLVPDVSQEPRYYPMPETSGSCSALVVPLKVKEATIGVLDVESDRLNAFDESDLVMLQSLADQAAIAIENARLYEHARELAIVEERQRLARDLHDAVTQTLFSASLIAEVLPRIWERNPVEGRRRLEEVRELTRGALAEMRTLLLELRPAALVEAELGDLLRQLAESITGRARVPVMLEIEGECSLTPDVKVSLYRIAQEALNNVAKHSGASQATLSLRCQPERVELRVSDDGRGFDPESISPESLGLGIMHERAETFGATLEIESQAGQGTQVMVLWENR
jgi:ligand-binding sensor domain-containing protein/signal transduction histidine kinase